MSDPVMDLIQNGGARKGATSIERTPSGVPLPKNFKPGLIGVVAGDLSRYSEFNISLCAAIAASPLGSELVYTRGVDVSGNCNEIIRKVLSLEKADWVWILGDDHTFEQGLLLRMLEGVYSEDLDLLVPHVLKRTPPWPPVVYSHQDEHGWYVAANLPREGLTRIHAAGSAGMLIRRRVLEALEDPWFRPAPDAAGLNEDLYFCQQVREAGFELWCDPALPMGHIAVHSVRPTYGEGGWHVAFVFDEDNVFAVPSIVQSLEEQVPVS
jgi:hypothetical protein